jgi:hypothetical protein
MKKIKKYSVKEFDDRTVYYYGKKIHRKDKPAVIFTNGRKEWYKHGKLHRKGAPAVLDKHGEEWFHNGKRHRKGLPAITTKIGDKYYYHKNQLHRLSGPAVILANENNIKYPYKEYFIADIALSETEFKKIKSLLKRKHK